MAWKRDMTGGILVFIGYLLSLLSWWNDLFVNVPLAPAFAWVISVFAPRAFAASLVVSYWLTDVASDFSILYAPEEYACDASATMRVTAYLKGTQVGTATTNAPAGTWPSETLSISLAFQRLNPLLSRAGL